MSPLSITLALSLRVMAGGKHKLKGLIPMIRNIVERSVANLTIANSVNYNGTIATVAVTVTEE